MTTVTLMPDPAPREMFLPVISVDDHVLEPPDIFTSRLTQRMANSAPHMAAVDGMPQWLIDGQPVPILTANATVGRPVEEWRSHDPMTYEEARPGAWDPDARIADMDLNGVWGSLNFPSLPWGFSGRALSDLKDIDLGLACVQAYNDWYHEEWTSRHPARFLGSQIPWLNDPTVAATEIRRNAARGTRAVSFTENPQALGRPSLHTRYWDPFFAACADTGTVINLHVGSAGLINRPSTDSPTDVAIALFPLSSMTAVVDWIFSLVPVRFPNLKIALSEGGASWVPTIAERLARAFRQCDHPESAWERSYGHPVDVLRRNFFFASIEDPSAFRLLDVIGDDKVMLEVDYPHQDSSWPDTQKLINEELRGLDASVAEKIAWRNAVNLYGATPPPARDWRGEGGRTYPARLGTKSGKAASGNPSA
jgi:predicted TIM-barrel fold metal-dependent hydrolase